MGVEGENIKILVDGREIILAHPDIRRAKLLPTDDLFAASGGEQEDMSEMTDTGVRPRRALN